MRKKTHGRNIDNIVVLIVFCTFAFSVLMVLMLGAGVYRNISDITRSSENERLAFSYVRTKIRNADNAGAFHVGEFDGISALYITEKIGETEYQTVIYVYDGYLCELFSDSSLKLSPADGTQVTSIDEMHFLVRDDGLIFLTVGDNNVSILPRSTGGAK